MPNEDDWKTGINCALAEACSLAEAACCKKGRLLLTPEEKRSIDAWLQSHAPGEVDTFQSRLKDFGDFYLYDQQDRCQFLDSANLCRLHTSGAKPTECFAWPLHVYVKDDQQLELRVGTSCCGAHQTILERPESAGDPRALFAGYSTQLIRAFRKEYPGGYQTQWVRTINDDELD